MVDTIWLLNSLKLKPHLHLGFSSFEAVSCFLLGIDYALEGDFLRGLREWLVLRADRGEGISWEGLVLRLVFPNEGCPNLLLARCEASNHHARDAMLDYIIAFWNERQERGLDVILNDYKAWREQQRQR